MVDVWVDVHTRVTKKGVNTALSLVAPTGIEPVGFFTTKYTTCGSAKSCGLITICSAEISLRAFEVQGFRCRSELSLATIDPGLPNIDLLVIPD